MKIALCALLGVALAGTVFGEEQPNTKTVCEGVDNAFAGQLADISDALITADVEERKVLVGLRNQTENLKLTVKGLCPLTLKN